jgi:hypothetical protein
MLEHHEFRTQLDGAVRVHDFAQLAPHAGDIHPQRFPPIARQSGTAGRDPLQTFNATGAA